MTYSPNLSKHDATKIPDIFFYEFSQLFSTICFDGKTATNEPFWLVKKLYSKIQNFCSSWTRRTKRKIIQFHFLIFSWCAIHFGLSYPWAFDGPYKEIYLCWDCILLEMVARARWSYAHPGQIFGSKWTIGVHQRRWGY